MISRIRSFPAASLVLAVALAGFWLYLAGLAVVGIHPRTPITGAWYALVGTVLIALAARRRPELISRLTARGWLRVTVVAGVLFLVLYLTRAATSGTGDLTVRSALLVVFLCVPSVLLALSLPTREREAFPVAVTIVAGLYTVLELALAYRGSHYGRYSPLSHLDPISAAAFPAIGLIAVLSLIPGNNRRRTLTLLALVVLLAFGAFLPGSRSPILGAACASLVVIALAWTRRPVVAAAATAAACAAAVAGFLAAGMLGTSTHLTADIPTISGGGHARPAPTPRPRPQLEAAISSVKIREELLTAALHGAVKRPLVGNGVGTLSSTGPEARRLGDAGCCTYPHDVVVEALYSLGFVSAAIYVLFLVATVVVACRLAVRSRSPGSLFAVGLLVYALVVGATDGALSDAPIWISAALAAAALADLGPEARRPS